MADLGQAISTESSIGGEFIRALGELEESGQQERLLRLFTPDCSLWNVMMHAPHTGSVRIRDFWSAYRGTFSRIRSEFTHREDTERCSVLEWRSEGSLVSGQPVEYFGVTVLEHDGRKITAFRSYFDTASLSMKRSA